MGGRPPPAAGRRAFGRRSGVRTRRRARNRRRSPANPARCGGWWGRGRRGRRGSAPAPSRRRGAAGFGRPPRQARGQAPGLNPRAGSGCHRRRGWARAPCTWCCRAAGRRNRRRRGPRRGWPAEPGAQIQHIEITPRRQSGAGAAAVPIGDEIERLRARLVRVERLAGDGDGGGQATLLVRVRSGILGEES